MENTQNSKQAAPVLGAPFSPVGFALRDYFAAVALAKLLPEGVLRNDIDENWDVAFEAYQIADAMIGMKEIAEEADGEREGLEN